MWSTGRRLLDRSLLQGRCDRRNRRLRRWGLRRNEPDDQSGRLDASISPGEAEARKPQPLAIESQAQKQRMNHQREEQRKR